MMMWTVTMALFGVVGLWLTVSLILTWIETERIIRDQEAMRALAEALAELIDREADDGLV